MNSSEKLQALQILQTPAAALFQFEFREDIFLLLGVIYFALLIFWLFSLWDEITKIIQSPEKMWVFFSIASGILFAFTAGSEWGWHAAGTATAIGLCISLALIHSSAATSLLASSLFLRPWELIENDPYLGMLPRLSFVLCLAHLLLYFAKNKKIDFAKNSITISLIAFTLWSFMTTLFAPDPGASQGAFFDGFIKSIFLFFILVQMVRTKQSFRILLITLLLSFLSVGLISVYQSVRISSLLTETDYRLRGFGAFKNSNDIAALMIFIMPFAVLAALRKTETMWLRVLGVSLSATALIAVVLSRSRGALLGIAAMLAAYFIIRIGKKAVAPVLIVCTLLFVPAMVLISSRNSNDLESSSEGRKTYLKAGIRMGVKNPVFGVGFDAFPTSLQRYSTESLDESPNMTAHNSWILAFAETGPIGLLLFTGAFVLCAISAWRIYPQSPEFLLALIGYGMTMFFLSHSYLIYPYLLYALVEIARSFRKPELC